MSSQFKLSLNCLWSVGGNLWWHGVNRGTPTRKAPAHQQVSRTFLLWGSSANHCTYCIFSFILFFKSMTHCHFPPVLCVCLASSSCSTSRCGSWTCWSGSSPAWFCTSYTLCCALSAGTTHCLWALFSSATTMSSSNYSETASCWAKPIPTLCPPTVWGSSRSKDYTARPLLQTLDAEARRMEAWWKWKVLGDLRDRLWTHNCVLIRFNF